MAFWSARLDETGTDGVTPYTVIAGAVALTPKWEALEAAWDALLTRYEVPAYHWKEFNEPLDKVFGGWSKLKKGVFVRRQEKIILRHTKFRVSVGIDRAVHADVKKRMRGIKGFHAESDYGLGLRYLMHMTCEQLVKHVDLNCSLSILVEDGPWAAGAATTYQHVAAMTAKRKPAKHAHRLNGFATAPKGRRSLEAADYLAGTELARLLADRRPPRGVPNVRFC